MLTNRVRDNIYHGQSEMSILLSETQGLFSRVLPWHNLKFIYNNFVGMYLNNTFDISP